MQAITKEIAWVLMPFAVTYFMFYLIGSFVSVSFDPTIWTPECRIICSVFGFAWGVALLTKLEMMR